MADAILEKTTTPVAAKRPVKMKALAPLIPVAKAPFPRDEPVRIAPFGLFGIKQGEEWYLLETKEYPYGTANPMTDTPLGAYRDGNFLYHDSLPFGKRFIFKRGESSR